ncbi:ribonuclease HII [Candidatus Peregrinibacteria bacterium]|nr:ribonuclease HII [Candidatus Peregrinibacteria bacterium]
MRRIDVRIRRLLSSIFNKLSITAIIAGIDEAGRGALAGPVVAAACVLKAELFRKVAPFLHWSPKKRKNQTGHCRIGDSKKLTPEERAVAYEWITRHSSFGVGMSPSEDVETLGILGATEKAMHLALKDLEKTLRPTYLLVDGRDAFWFDYPHSSLIGGDGLEPCIAAASIIAKVTRDRWMTDIAKHHASFGFDRHKGYGTAGHFAALKVHGPCAIHRKNFLRKFFETGETTYDLSDAGPIPIHLQSSTPARKIGSVSS